MVSEKGKRCTSGIKKTHDNHVEYLVQVFRFLFVPYVNNNVAIIKPHKSNTCIIYTQT